MTMEGLALSLGGSHFLKKLNYGLTQELDLTKRKFKPVELEEVSAEGGTKTGELMLYAPCFQPSHP